MRHFQRSLFSTQKSLIGYLTVLLFFPLLLCGQTNSPDTSKLRFFGDFRFRGEHDWDSRRFDGSYRGDRSRMRIRLRFGFNYRWNQYITFGARIRSGVPNNIQSPHFNLGYKGFTSNPFQIDRFYFKGAYENFWWWAGKNGMPFWKQNELWWDDDVQPEGISVGLKTQGDGIKWQPTLGYYIVNHDHNGNVIDGSLFAGQLALTQTTDAIQWTVAGGLYLFDNIYNVPEADTLFTGNRYKMDYYLFNSGLQVTVLKPKPLKIGLDYMLNLTDYAQDDNIDAVYKDQKSGYVFSLLYGKLATKKDWLLGYYYVHKEELSVVSYFGEDDWVRWGNIHRNRNTNYRGHELRIAYCWGKNFNSVLRFYTVQGLVTPQKTTESGNRVRLDFNIKF